MSHRTRVLPLIGPGPDLPVPADTLTEEASPRLGEFLVLLGRTWPFLRKYILGRWATLIGTPENSPKGLLWWPLLMIVVFTAGAATAAWPVFGPLLLLTLGAGFYLRIPLRPFAVRVRVGADATHFYLAIWLVGALAITLSAFLTDFFVQNILIGAPLTPPVGALLDRPAGVPLTQDQRRELVVLFIGFSLLVWFVTRPLALGLPYYNIWIQQQINQDLRLTLMEHWSRLSLRHHTRVRVGDSIYRLLQDSAQVTTVIARMIAITFQLVALVSAVFLLTAFDPRLAALAAAMAVPVLIYTALITPRLRAASLAARRTNSALTSRVDEILVGLRQIKSSGQEAREQAAFEADSAAAFNGAYRIRSLVATATVVCFALTCAGLLAGEYLTATWANAGQRTVAAPALTLMGLSFAVWNAGAFTWAQGQMFGAAQGSRAVASEWSIVQDTAMALRRVFAVLDIAPEVADATEAKPAPERPQALAFEDVTFSYDPARPVLKGVSFTARAGQVTALVGPTGAGKSTIAALALRLFDPDCGVVRLDGENLRTLSVESLRARVSLALQESPLFAISIADNIRYAAPNASDDAVEAAARAACADNVVAGLPEGYATVLGDRGYGLSPGQRQRLSLARALVRDAPVLILDEPTAALDPATEARVMANLKVWGEGRIILIITHRLSTIREADQILMLEGGIIAEAGSHAALAAKPGGRYRAFVASEAALAGAGQ